MNMNQLPDRINNYLTDWAKEHNSFILQRYRRPFEELTLQDVRDLFHYATHQDMRDMGTPGQNPNTETIRL